MFLFSFSVSSELPKSAIPDWGKAKKEINPLILLQFFHLDYG